MSDWIGMSALVADDNSGGIIQCEFLHTGSLSQLRLSAGAYKLLTLPNAGGNSALSEALSFELMQRCFRARLMKTEMEVTYFPMGGAMTDYVCSIAGQNIAVSVTRAMKFKGHYTEEDAECLLNKKLKGVVQSSQNALDKWTKQILHIWATSTTAADAISAAYHNRVRHSLKSNTVVLVTTAAVSHFIFTNS